MSEHPIEGLMKTAMNSIKDMVDVNTIIGEPIETSNGMVIIPISKVCFGFAAGGSEFSGETINEYKKKDKEEEVQYRLPFGGGSGAGVSINPVGFVIVNKDSIKVMPIEHTSAIDKLMDYVPDLMQRVNNIVNKSLDVKKCECQNEEIKKEKENLEKEKNERIEKNKSKINEVKNNNFKVKNKINQDKILRTKQNKKQPNVIEDVEIDYEETEIDENLEDE